MVNSAIYRNMLLKVRDPICEKCRNEFRRNVVRFQQHNPPPFMYDDRLDALQASVGLVQHPTHSPDIATSDLYLFSHLQLHFDGAIFNLKEVINEADLFLDSALQQVFAERIQKLPKCCQTVVDTNGDYYPH